MSDTMNNRFFTIFWVSFAMMLALIVGVIVYDFCSEDEVETEILQEGRVVEKKRRKIKQVGRIGSAAKPVDTEAQLVEYVVEGESDNESSETVSVIAYEEWERIFDGLVKLQNEGKRPAAKQVADFKAAFDKLSDEVKLENIPHAQNLFSDASIEYLTVILFDTKEPKDVLSSIYYDLLNRPEELKMPIIRKLAADKSHPLSEEAFDLLVMVDDPAIKNF